MVGGFAAVSVVGALATDGRTLTSRSESPPGDLVVVVSDGVTESQNSVGEEYGRDRLRAQLESMVGRDQQSVLEAVTESVAAFAGAAPQVDDLTVLVLNAH